MENVCKITMAQFDDAYRRGKLPPEQLVRASVKYMMDASIADAFGDRDDDWWHVMANMTPREAQRFTVREAIDEVLYNPCEGRDMDIVFVSRVMALNMSISSGGGCYAAVGSLPVLDFVRYVYRNDERWRHEAEENIRRLYRKISDKKCFLQGSRRICPPELEKMDLYHFLDSICIGHTRAMGLSIDDVGIAGEVLMTHAARKLFPEKFFFKNVDCKFETLL